MNIGGRKVKAHRISYELFVGPIPDGMFVCHKCDIRECVNPSHLFIGTQQDNMDDMKAKGRERHVFGSDRKNSVLNEETVLMILADSGTHMELARKYSVAKATIYNVKHRKLWKHVPWPSEENR